MGNVRTLAQKAWFLRHYSSALPACLDYQCLHPIASRNGLSFVRARSPSLLPYVAIVIHTLNWGFVKNIRFSEAVSKYGFYDSLESFAVLVGTFRLAGMRNEVRGLLTSIVESQESIWFDLFWLLSELVHLSNGSLRLFQVYDNVVRIFAEKSMLVDAYRAYMMIRPDIRVPTCNFLMKCFVDGNDVGYAQSLFYNMKSCGPPPDVNTYTILLELYTRGDTIDMDGAYNILFEMERNDVRPNEVTYATYLRGLCRAGSVNYALKFLRCLKDRGLPLNIYCYNAVMHGFCCEGNLQMSRKVFDEAKKYRFLPDVYSYSILIDGFCKVDDYLEGRKLLEEMINREIKPNTVSYSSLLNGLCMTGKMDDAFILFKDIRNLGYEHDQIFYSILIDGYCRKGHMINAFIIWAIIQKKFNPDVFNYTSLIYGYCRSGSIKKAIKFFNLMLGGGVMPNVVTCTALVNGLCQVNSIVEAFEFLSGIQDLSIFPNLFTYNTLINGLCKKGNLDKAYEILGSMVKRAILPDVVTYGILIDSYVKMSDLEGAFRLFAKMPIADITPPVFIYATLISGIYNDCRMMKNSVLLDKIRKTWGLIPDRYISTCLISGYCRRKDIKKAFEVANGLTLDSYLFTCLINGWCKLLMMDKAVELMNAMIKCGLTPNVVTYSALINGYRKMGDTRKAYQMYNVMLKHDISPDYVTFVSLGLEPAEKR